MSNPLFPYYERELLFIRQLAQEFARQYPAAAGRLLLEPNRSADPHVERLLEGFAFLAGRIHHKLDDDFPELTDAILQILYPHYLAPIPSLAIVQFDLDPGRAALPDGFEVPRHSRLTTAPVQDLPCKFRTAYPVKLWPVRLTKARWQTPPFAGLTVPPRTAAALRLEFETMAGLKFHQLSLDKLRLFLFNDNQVVPPLYEALFNEAVQIQVRPLDGAKAPPLVLSPQECLRQVGFDADQSLLPYPGLSFVGYRHLTEFFAFPQKYLFVDLGGWQRICQAGFQERLEVILFFRTTNRNLEQGIDAGTFRLGCTPIVNLFDQVAEPMPWTQVRHEQRIVPDVAYPQGMEVYSVNTVMSTDPVTNRTTEYQPFYSYRHGRTLENTQTFWYASRRRALEENDRGTDVYLTLVDLGFTPTMPADATVVVHTTCTNRDLPLRLQLAGEALAFNLEAPAPLERVRCLRPPTAPLRPPQRRGHYWRLISHLTLNHLSLTGAEGREALQEILRLYDFSDPEAGQQQLAMVNRQIVDGIMSVSSRRVLGRVPDASGAGFCRGVEVTVEFDEEKYVGAGVFLFASVLERFLGLYASINSFSQLVARTKQGEGLLKKWPPRAGELQLL